MTRVQGPKGGDGEDRLPLNPVCRKIQYLPSPQTVPDLLFFLSLLDFFPFLSLLPSLSLSLFSRDSPSSSSSSLLLLLSSNLLPPLLLPSLLPLSLSQLNSFLHTYYQIALFSLALLLIRVLPSPSPSSIYFTPPPPPLLYIATLFPPFYSVPFRVSTSGFIDFFLLYHFTSPVAYRLPSRALLCSPHCQGPLAPPESIYRVQDFICFSATL